MSHNKIDVHTHILPPEIPSFRKMFGTKGHIVLQPHDDGCGADMVDDTGKFFRRVEKNCFCPKQRMKEMDQFGVQIQVLSTVPVMFSYWTKGEDGAKISRILNEQIAGVVQKNPGRFVGLGQLPLQDPDLAIRELDYALDELSLNGFQVGSHINDWNLSAPELFPVFQRIWERKASLFVHPWDMMGKERMPDYWLPWLVGMPAESALAASSLIFSGVLEKLPGLKVAIAHGGGSFPYTFGRICHGHHVRPDLCAVDNKPSPRKYQKALFFDSLVHSPEALKFLIDFAGVGKVMLGTDYPFPLGELSPGELIEGSIEDAALKRQLLFENACEWLGLDAKELM